MQEELKLGDILSFKEIYGKQFNHNSIQNNLISKQIYNIWFRNRFISIEKKVFWISYKIIIHFIMFIPRNLGLHWSYTSHVSKKEIIFVFLSWPNKIWK